MLLFLLFCLPLLTFTRNQIQQKVLAYAIAPPILQTHVIDNWWGVLYPPPALSGGVMPEENSKNQSADSVSDALIFDNDMNWLSQKKHIIFDVNKKDTALISSKADPMTCSNHSECSLLRHNLRHRQGMDDIGLPALALLVLVGLCRKFKGRPDVLEVCRRIVAPDSLFQVLILFLNGHDTTPPLLPAASSRRRDR